MPLNQKESTLLGDLRSQEQLCVDKYTQYANDACDSQLKNLFTQIRAHEQQHMQTLDQIASGIVPQMQQGSQQSPQQGSNQQTMQFQPGGGQQSGSQQGGGQQGMQFQPGGGQQSGSQQSGGQQGNQQRMQFQPSNCSPEGKKKDAYLCQDALGTEKHVSSTYNTCIFEFRDPNVRNALNHIQKEEQQHGEQIYSYMAANGMYS